MFDMRKRTPKATGYSERMHTAREAAGLSYESAAAELRQVLHPAQWVSSATVRRLERVIPEQKADPILLWALARVYGVPLKQLSRGADQWMAEHFNRPTRACITADSVLVAA